MIHRVRTRTTQPNGFTIIELLVVIAVIGILATISVVGYGAWRHSTLISQVKSDLNGAAAAMENYRTFNNGYPHDPAPFIPDTFTSSNDVTLTIYEAGSSATAYCVDAVSTVDPSIIFYIGSDSNGQGALPGTCATATPPLLKPSGLIATVISSSQVNLSWNTVAGTDVTYTIQRSTASNFDPIATEVTQPSTTYSSTGLLPIKTYYYRVKALTPGGSGPWSVVSTTTPAYFNQGIVTTLAGSNAGYSDGTGAAAQFFYLADVAVDPSGMVYVADTNNNRIRKITPAGVVTTLAGSTEGSSDGTGAAAQFNRPGGIAVDTSGNVYVVDSNNNRIRKITPAGVVTTLAGSTSGYVDATGTNAKFSGSSSIAVDSSGTLYVADSGNNRIRKITPAGVVTTLAGSTSGYVDATGTNAQFAGPRAVTVDTNGTLYVADSGNNRIRKITPAGVVTTLAGSTVGYIDATGISAKFTNPYDVAVDTSGTVYVVDRGNYRIRKITPAGVVTTLAGSLMSYSDGTGASAKFAEPSGIAIDSFGILYVADTLNQRVRKIQ